MKFTRETFYNEFLLQLNMVDAGNENICYKNVTLMDLKPHCIYFGYKCIPDIGMLF